MSNTEQQPKIGQQPSNTEQQESVVGLETFDIEEELLIAYLDGELPIENKKKLEERLAHEPTLRRKLARFEETWDALELLERKTSDQVFISSTMEHVAMQTAHEIQVATLHSWAGFKGWAFRLFLGSIVSAFLGYMSVDFLFSQNLKNLYNDVPMIERLDQYFLLDEQKSYDIDELEFLRELNDAKIFD